MKKRLLQLILVFAMPAVLVNCAQSNKDDHNSDDAAAALTTTCLQNNGCNSNQYNGYSGFFAYQQTAMNYGFQNQSQNNFCGCGYSGRPVYHNDLGMGCVYTKVVAPVAHLMVFVSLVNSQWTTTSNTGASGSGCYTSVGQACFSNQSNSCGSGYTCRSSANSNLGICSRN